MEIIEVLRKPWPWYVAGPLKFNLGYVYGSLLFGIGWGLTGACRGPIYVQIGSGLSIALITLVSALAGTWVYSYLKPRLPH